MSNAAEKQAAIKKLQEWLKDGDTLYCITRKRSLNGEKVYISLVYFIPDGRGGVLHRHPTYSVGLAIGWKTVRLMGDEAIEVKGSGFNRADYLVGTLAVAIGRNLKSEEL